MSRETLRRRITEITRDLLTRFVPRNLGFSHLSREQAFEHTTHTSRALFLSDQQIASKAKITIWDATYIRIEKSANITAQQKTYSMHKKASLIKPMISVFPDGYIYEIFPLHEATLNDAAIFNQTAQRFPNFNATFTRGDVFLFDRGFRDSSESLTRQNFHVFHPAFMAAGSNQLTTAQANHSRK